MAKAVILMMDSFGIGGAKDAAAFGDAGANTFLHIAQNYPEFGGNGLALPNLEALGLANAGELASGVRAPLVSGRAKMTLAGRCKYGCMEEISAGKSVQTAIKSGFQKAFSAILDGNVTTLIAAFVLNWLGTGSVKGFAQTLALGIVLSMFTALVVSRFVMYAVYAVGVRDKKFYGAKKEREPIHFLAKKKIFFTISLILVLSAPVAMIIFGKTTGSALKYSLEFQGGTSTNVTFKEDMTIQEIDSKVTPVVEEVTGDKNIQATKVVGRGNQREIRQCTGRKL